MANEKVWTSEQRVKAAVPDAVAMEMENGSWRIYTAGNRVMALAAADADEAWKFALEDRRVIAFESTLRVQDAPADRGYTPANEADRKVIKELMREVEEHNGMRAQDAPEVVREGLEDLMRDTTDAFAKDAEQSGEGNGGELPLECSTCEDCGAFAWKNPLNGEWRHWDMGATYKCGLTAKVSTPKAKEDAEGKPKHDLSLDVNQLPSVVAVQSVPHPFSRRENYLRCNTCGLTEEAPCHAANPLSPDAGFEKWIESFRFIYQNSEPFTAVEIDIARRAWNAALRTRPKGEAKVTWRVDGGWVSRGDDVFHQYYRANEESAKIYAASWVDAAMPGTPSERWANVVKIDTYETVVETRKKEA